MELNDLNPLSAYKIKSLKKFKIYFIYPSGKDVLSSPQWTGCGPSLANGVCLGVCQTSWQQLSCPSSWGSCPQTDQWQLFPSLPWSPPPFVVHKNWGQAGDTIFWCAPGFIYSFAMMLNAEGLCICIWLIWRICRLVHFWFLHFNLSWLLDLSSIYH